MKRIKFEQLLSDPHLLQEFCADVQNGAVVVLPTDTLYGFAVDAANSEAIARVYQIKNRSSRKPLILFVHSIDELQSLGFAVSDYAQKCLNDVWPGALTAVFSAPSHKLLAAFTFDSLGVRVPDHTALLKLLQILPIKLLTTSANRSGDPSDVDPDIIAREFAAEVDWLLDDGVLAVSLPSTVADFTFTPPQILRQGKIKL